MADTDPIRVGILSDPYCYAWQARAIERVREELAVDIPLVVYNDSKRDRDEPTTPEQLDRGAVSHLVDGLRREKAWTVVTAMRTIARRFGDERTLRRRRSVATLDFLDDAEYVPCEPRIDDGWYTLPDTVVDRLAEECDVVVRFGFGLLRGNILTAPEHGVLSFHPADIRKYRGLGPPAIFHDGRDRAGATLQRLDESIDGGAIVAYDEVSLDGCYTLWDVFDRVATLQIRLLVDGIVKVGDPTFEPQLVPDDRLGEFYSLSRRRSLSFSGRVLAKNLAGRVRRRLDRRPDVDDRSHRTEIVDSVG